jgi:hypothetical protein
MSTEKQYYTWILNYNINFQIRMRKTIYRTNLDTEKQYTQKKRYIDSIGTQTNINYKNLAINERKIIDEACITL